MWTIVEVFIEYVITPLFFFNLLVFLEMRHVESELPNQGWDLHPLNWKVKS